MIGEAEAWAMLRAMAELKQPPEGGAAGERVVSLVADGAAPPRAVWGERADAILICRAGGEPAWRREPSPEARGLLELYGPLCRPLATGARRGSLRQSFVVAHLGQSLDGRIAPPSGTPEAITGPLDMAHNHRMRALFDVVLVGAGTVCHDDPSLTVRHVEGRNPVRVVVDPDRRLADHYRVFNDDAAATLLLCRAASCTRGERHGRAEVVGVEDDCSPRAVIDALAQRRLTRVFIEGGGVTVSRFLAAGCLSRLQLAVSPLIMGNGRAGIELDETLRLRPHVRRFQLADDILFECCFDEP